MLLSTVLQHWPAWLPVTDHHQLFNYLSFGLFAIVFVLSVLSMNKGGQYQYQLKQFTWTLLSLLLVVAQVKTTMYTIYSGLFWFVFPFMLVIANDTFAYFVGTLCKATGLRLTKKQFLALSPNKTWEGFLGAGVLTLLFAYFAAPLFGTSSLRCSYNEVQAGATMCSNDYLWKATD